MFPIFKLSSSYLFILYLTLVGVYEKELIELKVALEAVYTILSFLSLLRVLFVYVLLTGPSASVSC